MYYVNSVRIPIFNPDNILSSRCLMDTVGPLDYVSVVYMGDNYYSITTQASCLGVMYITKDRHEVVFNDTILNQNTLISIINIGVQIHQAIKGGENSNITKWQCDITDYVYERTVKNIKARGMYGMDLVDINKGVSLVRTHRVYRVTCNGKIAGDITRSGNGDAVFVTERKKIPLGCLNYILDILMCWSGRKIKQRED